MNQAETPLEAVIQGVTIIEDDPNELTVGYGGLPNEDGVVELDAAVMDGPTGRGAGVAAMQNVRHAARVASFVMERTNRVLLVGEGAKRFALANGFPHEDLLTEQAREMWLYWKRTRSASDDWLPPADSDAQQDVARWFEERFYGNKAREGTIDGIDAEPTGTVHCSALNAAGDLACSTTTSGHAFKLAGRVGDSPILGAGLFVDNQVGSCGSIGHGEANLRNLSSFLAVELMRGGATPAEAGLEVLRRVASTALPHERDESGRANFNLRMFLLQKSGEHAGVAMWGPKTYAVCDGGKARLESCISLYQKSDK